RAPRAHAGHPARPLGRALRRGDRRGERSADPPRRVPPLSPADADPDRRRRLRALARLRGRGVRRRSTARAPRGGGHLRLLQRARRQAGARAPLSLGRRGALGGQPDRRRRFRRVELRNVAARLRRRRVRDRQAPARAKADLDDDRHRRRPAGPRLSARRRVLDRRRLQRRRRRRPTRALGQAKIDAQVHTFTDMVSGTARPALVALTAAVALLLVLACANVGNLLLLRAAGRVREMAIRRAIGASAGALVRQLLTESLLLALAGGVLGTLFGRALLDGLLRMAPSGLPRLDMIALAGTPVVVVELVTGVTVLLFGIVPALAAVRFDLSSPLRSDIRSGTEGRKLRKVRQMLVASQIALAVVVLAGAGLLLKSLERLTTLDMGYSTEHLLLLNFSLPWEKYTLDCKPQGGAHTAADTSAWSHCIDATNYAAHGRVISNIRTIGGIVAASPEEVPPFLGSNVWMGRYAAQNQSDAEAKANPWLGLDGVGP